MGDFKDGMLNGEGTVSNNIAQYEGTFKNDQLHGKWRITYHENKKGKQIYLFQVQFKTYFLLFILPMDSLISCKSSTKQHYWYYCYLSN